MGLMGNIRSAAKGLASSEARFRAVAEHSLELPHAEVFRLGTIVETIPTESSNIVLDFGRLATYDTLQKGDRLQAEINLSSLDTLSDLLALRIGNPKGAFLSLPMQIEQLDEAQVLLAGTIKNLGHCSLGIALREHAEELTCAQVQLDVAILPMDIRTAAETQRVRLEELLQGAMGTFSEQYIENIRQQATRDITA